MDPRNSPTWSFTYNALGHRAQWAYGSSGAADQHLFDPDGTWLGIAGSYSLVSLGGRYLVVYLGGATYLNHVNAPVRLCDGALAEVKGRLNPARRGLVKSAEDWKWWSMHEYAGVSAEEQERRCGLRIDGVRLPADENTRS